MRVRAGIVDIISVIMKQNIWERIDNMKKESIESIEYGIVITKDYLRESDNSSVPDSELVEMANSTMPDILKIFEKLLREG